MKKIKCLQKSSNPILLNKSIVPYGKKIPYMCKLIKYFESDSTIFLLIEYLALGKLSYYLSFLLEYGDSFLANLNNFKTMKRQHSIENSKMFTNYRRKSFEIDLNSSNKNGQKNIRRAFSVREDYKILDSAEKLSELNLESNKINENSSSDIKINNSTNSERSSSIDETAANPDNQKSNSENEEKVVSIVNLESSSSNDNIDETNKNKNATWQMSNPLKKIINLDRKSKNSIIKFKNKSSGQNETAKPKITQKCSPYITQVKTWLAQLAYSLKCLHDLGIVCKDLRSDNLLLASNGQLSITYMSKWNLVDEKLNKQAVKNFYVAPELTGLVNYESGESCDWWSFGVIAYELLTLKVLKAFLFKFYFLIF